MGAVAIWATGCTEPAVLDDSFREVLEPHFGCITRTLDPGVVFELNSGGPDGWHSEEVLTELGRAVQNCGESTGTDLALNSTTTRP